MNLSLQCTWAAICLEAAWGLSAPKASGPLACTSWHGWKCVMDTHGHHLLVGSSLVLWLSPTIPMLSIFSQCLIPEGLHCSLSLTVPSVESHMQTNMSIHLVNFWTFFLMCVECIKRKVLSFPPTQLYGLESCELGLFLKTCWVIFAHPVSSCFPKGKMVEEKTVSGYC